MSGNNGLLPEAYEDFGSVEFWDGFFEKRGAKPFEWYGNWKQLQPLMQQDCKSGKEVLVVGCGNSELSAHLYDAGCEHITNVDFSKRVIASMMKQNLRQRPKMKWKVGDMTDLKFPDANFEVVVDKGGLDALMGEDSSAGTEAGGKLLAEATRVLCKGGLLLSTLRSGWQIELFEVPPSPDMALSTLQPIFVRAEKIDPSKAAAPIATSIRPSKQAPNAEQLAEICQVVNEEDRSLVDGSDRSRHFAEAATSSSHDFDRLHPGRRLSVALPHTPDASCRAGDPSFASSGKHEQQGPRFRATVMDVEGQMADAALHQCCVFIVPQGRDSEWLFASVEGQWQVANQCGCKRVILVALDRSHSFGTIAEVRAKLSPLVEPLAAADVRGLRDAIPIMTTGEGVGTRRVLEQLESAISGRVVVEDVALQEGEQTTFARRMVFVSNQNLIQSEARLTAPQPAGTAASAPSAAGKKKGKKKLAARQDNAEVSAFSSLQLDHSCLAMEYHKAIIAGVSLCSGLLHCSTGSDPGSSGHALVVGLGGGGLAVFLHRFVGMSVKAVELDEAVVGLAKRHFGFSAEAGLQVHVGDGLTAVADVAESEPQSLDILVVDAGSGDASLAMSCPPAAFLEQQFLENASRALKLGGLLAINCVTRSDAAFRRAARMVQVHFRKAYEVNMEDDVNRVLFAIKTNWHQQLDRKTLAEHGRLIIAQSQSLKSEQADDILQHLSALQLVAENS